MQPSIASTTMPRMVIFGTMLLGQFLSALDGTIVGVALPRIATEFHHLNLFSWVISAYFLTSAVCTPWMGRFSDHYGRRFIYSIGITTFAMGSLLCAVANNMTVLILGRLIQGVGGGVFTVMAQIVVADLYPPAERAPYITYVGATYALAAVSGPLLGGVLTDQASWRWIFWINLPLCGVAAAMTYGFMGHLSASVSAVSSTIPSVDWLGSILISLSTVCFTLAATWGGHEYAWDHVVIICLLLASVLFALIFGKWERQHPMPIFPFSLFHIRNISIVCCMAIAVGATLFGLMAYLPLFFQMLYGKSIMNSGLMTIPFVLSANVGSLSTGQFIRRTGQTQRLPFVGGMFTLIGLVLLTFVDEHTSLGYLIPSMVVTGVGLGIAVPVCNVIAQNCAPTTHMAVATSLVLFLRTLGATIAAIIFGSVLNGVLTTQVTNAGLPAVMAAYAPAAIWSSRVSTTDRAPFLHAYSKAVEAVVLAMMPLMGIATIVSIVMQPIVLRKPPPPPAIHVVAPTNDASTQQGADPTTMNDVQLTVIAPK